MEAKAIREEALMARSSGRDALNHAIAAADLYMKAAKEAASPADRVRFRKKCEGLITHAEQLKSSPRATPATTTKATTVITSASNPNCHVRQIPSNERAILLRSSRLHGNIFPPWQSDPVDGTFSLPEGKHVFSDPTEYTMSPRQQSILEGWKRPVEQAREETVDRDFMASDSDCDLVQDVTTDCSVVASLCAAMKILQRGRQSVLGSIMFPYDHAQGRPKISRSGKYMFRMHFNGCFRQVVVDDRLPVSRNNRTLFVVDRKNPNLLWPALLEKAYLKVRGGYDFPGSNSGTDLWVITGWIPEQLFLQSEDVDLEGTWDDIKEAYHAGNLIITLGTGRLTQTEEDALGLVGEHDYAVLEIDISPGARRLLVKNPWCDGLVWKGVGSSGLLEKTAALSLSATSVSVEPKSSEHSRPVGSFWISVEDVAQNFESMYLNWNPDMFTHRQDHHFTWRVPTKNMTSSLAHNPQYSVLSSSGDEVWILLSRHFADEELNIARNKSASSAAPSRQLGFTSIFIFESEGKKVQVREGFVYQGSYVDSPQTLAKFRLRAGKPYTIVMAHQDLPLHDYSCTFTLFSRTPLEVKPAEEEMRYYKEFSSAWTRRTAGGNASSITYSQNPQFSISIPRATSLSILLSSGDREVAIHVDLVWAHGKRVTSIGVKDVVASSGDYRRGNALVQVPLVEPGTYTIVCSTWEPGQLADFGMRVGSQVECQIQPVLSDGAGLLRTRTPAIAFSEGEEKRRAPVTVTRLSRAQVVARCPLLTGRDGQHIPTTAVRISLVYGRGPEESVLAMSGGGEFRELTMAVRTPEFDLEPDRLRQDQLWLVVEQLGSQQGRQSIEVEFLSDNAIHVGDWQIVDG
ncbi:PALB protein [Colletotrichum higginsianum IMI 349063]|uniref:PALB protein n=2 Tax=Colletotrichum higginsianum (strain IMI 349063) TaxID=759273 RepID=A0A1B7YPI2_COLHI|nr:PALB protein [Colletotrichum higginsianum IMI 349063]OBR13862.1 PALB protein [Colletotrichum higginsianum IMI 349063]